MNKKGFTLTELLAVIVILSVVMLIGSTSIAAVRKQIDKSMFQSKLEFVISAAKSYGQDNKEQLVYNDITMTAGNLIEHDFLQSDEVVDISEYPDCESLNIRDGKCNVLTNNIDDSIVNKLEVFIYKKNNRVYACILKNDNNKNLLMENNEWSEHSNLNYYCEDE